LPGCHHVSRQSDAAAVARTAEKEDACLILVGIPTDSLGEQGPAGRRVRRFAAALRKYTSLPVKYWDESDSTVRASQLCRILSTRRKTPSLSTHSAAAAVILQDYLDTHASQNDPPGQR